jgi:phage tail sheath protein FI
MPPPGRHGDLGPAAVLAAEQYCRRRGAMLVMDPPSGWLDAEAAITGIRHAGHASPNILAYFPRMIVRSERAERPRAAGGAIAGLMCRHDRRQGPWEPLSEEARFSRRLAPAVELDAEAVQRLAREGLNPIIEARPGQAVLGGSVTLARNSQLYGRYASLAVRRLCLAMTGAVEHATRWSVFEAGSPRVAERVQAQVHAYLVWLADSGAFADDLFTVHCEADRQQRGVTLLLAFRPRGAGEALTLSLHQTAAGCRVTSSAFPPPIARCA